MAVIAMATTACAQEAETTESSDILNSEAYVELYQDTIEGFPEPLPGEASFPDLPPALDGDIGRGNAAGAAYFYWVCAWEDVYLQGDPAQATAAMEQLRRFPDTVWGNRYYVDPDNIWGATLDAAELGDLTELRAFYESDCDFYRNRE